MKQLLILAVLSSMIVSCKDIKDPELRSIENVAVKKLALTESIITLRVKYFNPNHFAAKLKEADGEAWIDSSYLGHFSVDSLIQVPSYSEFIVPVDLTLDMNYLLKNSMSAFSKDEVFIKIKGTAKAGRNGFYKKFSLDYEGKQNLGKLVK